MASGAQGKNLRGSESSRTLAVVTRLAEIASQIMLSQHQSSAHWALALVGLIFIACSGDTESSEDAGAFEFGDVDTSVDLGDVSFDTPEPSRCAEVDRLTAIRMRSAPGGRQLHISLADSEGRALDAGFVTCISLSDPELGDLPLVHSVSETGPGATLIVAQLTPENVADSREFIDAFVAQRPSDERIAVWAWSETLVQVVGATSDRALLENRLDARWTANTAAPAPAGEIATVAAEEWEDISDHALLGPRSIVFVAPNLELESLPDIDRDYVTDFWVVGSTGTRQYPGDVGIAATGIAAVIDSVLEEGLSVLAFCDDGGPLELSFTSDGEVIRRVSFGDAALEHLDAACDLQVILDAAPQSAPVIEVEFSSAERARFEELAENRDSATSWTGELRIPGELAAAPFSGSFRGRSSLGCDRKSMSINLAGNDARHIVDSSGTDEFFLISMCLDDRYINQINGDRLMAEFGLWQLEWTTTEVRIDDESRGVYLFVEDLDQEFRLDRSRLRSVIRRRTDIDGKPADVAYAFDDEGDALARYDQFLASFNGLSGDDLVEALEASMDLEQYLRWVALMTLLGNGDYVDEVFFISEETVDANGAPADFYTIHGWDPDDLFSDCHHSGRFALEDPNGLLYCTESVLDHLIFADDIVYARYVDTLDALIATLTPERFSDSAEATRDELLVWFEAQEVRDAMLELLAANPEATDRDVAVGEINDATVRLIASFEANREALLLAIAAYRGEQ